MGKIETKIGQTISIVDEVKSERMQLLIRPSYKNALKEIAEKEDISVNELVNRVICGFIEEYKETE